MQRAGMAARLSRVPRWRSLGASVGVLTDEAGRYTLRGISSGTISLRYMRMGYTTLTKTVTLGANDAAVVVDAQLETATAPDGPHSECF